LSLEQLLQDEIKESQRWIDTAEGVYKRDLTKRVELINWVLNNIKNPNICAIIESRMKEIIEKVTKKKNLIERDPLDSELMILDWILYQVYSNEIKKDIKLIE
jgi:predicted HNH restriction endonuclease